MKLTQFDKSILVQCTINSYARVKGVSIPEGGGSHGKVSWEYFKDKEKGSNCVAWWELDNGEEYSAGFMGYLDHPTYGKVGVICFQGTVGEWSGEGWRSNFNTNQVNQVKDFHTKKGKMVIPYGNLESKVKMHEGIIGVYSLPREIVREFAKRCFEDKIPLWLCGHSQGAGCCCAGYADIFYMLETDMNIPREEIWKFLTGYGAASLAIYNLEGAQSFNKRANGNFYNEWFGNDTVNGTPTWWQGYFQVETKKRYSDLRANLLAIVFTPLTLGLFPSACAWDHDPSKLLAAVKGEPIPLFRVNTTNDPVEKK